MLFTVPAQAGEPNTGEAIGVPKPQPQIVGGTDAAECQWPTTVAIRTAYGLLCSGALIHPRVVSTAAHCVAPHPGYPPVREESILFGESIFAPAFEMPVDYCLGNPTWVTNGLGAAGPEDYGFCVLSEAVALPPMPPLMGCELEALREGAEVVLAGFGATAWIEDDHGIKRWVATQLPAQSDPRVIEVGSETENACSGDSGSSGFIQLADGSWRSWGIYSGGGCDEIGLHIPLARAVGWIEDETGFDVTPCHDADGTWNPGPACRSFVSDPLAEGSWSEGCPGELGEESATCGPSLAESDLEPPLVDISFPDDEHEFLGVPAVLTSRSHRQMSAGAGWCGSNSTSTTRSSTSSNGRRPLRRRHGALWGSSSMRAATSCMRGPLISLGTPMRRRR